MANVIRITTSGSFNTNLKNLRVISKRFPQLTRDGMRKWGFILERDMRNSAILNLNKFTGILFSERGIRYTQRKKGDIGKLFIRHYGVMIDEMKPHYVSVRKSRSRLLLWAKRARNKNIREKANAVETGKMKRFGLYVKRHPWINQGYRVARPKLRPILRQSLNRGLKR